MSRRRPKAETKAEIDAEYRTKVDILAACGEKAPNALAIMRRQGAARYPGRPVSTGRGRAAGGKRVNVSASASEYFELETEALRLRCSVGSYILESALAAARAARKARGE